MSTRFISIGLPIYNGGEAVRRALDGLIAQSHSHFELIISDNASTDDETRAITEEYARHDSRIRLTRQPVNLGAVQNFIWVLQQARGDYFMWAAHDDFWSQNFIEVLANRLDASPQAILASPQCHVDSTRRNGTREQEVIPAAPNGDCNATLDVTSTNLTPACGFMGFIEESGWRQLRLSGHIILGSMVTLSGSGESCRQTRLSEIMQPRFSIPPIIGCAGKRRIDKPSRSGSPRLII